MTDPRLTDHARRNREVWDERSAAYQETHGPQLEKAGGTAWGVWQLPESELRMLGDVAGLDVLEFGCGAAQWSIALHAQGARVTGLDNSAHQLEHARALMRDAGVDFPLVHASAEATPLASESFDIVFCDHGAMTFCDPYLTVPEAARLLRPGGLLAFSMNTPICDLCWDPQTNREGERLVGDYWDLHILEEPGEAINFQLPYGEWIRLFGESGFVVESLIELRPPADAVSSYRDEGEREWARRWPMEHIWRARRVALAGGPS
jgi:SAM-dependent methyltransferase